MKPYLDDGDVKLYHGHVFDVLAQLPEGVAQMCVTSPPYWGLRDYGEAGQIGLEESPEAFVAAMVDVFRGVRRVLRDDGTLWLNLGDSYAGSGYGNHDINGDAWKQAASLDKRSTRQQTLKRACADEGLKPKDLVGIPWRVAFALQADGWWLRSAIVWAKPNPMPESVTDRPTSAYEFVFLLAPSAAYYYDADAIREEPKPNSGVNMRAPSKHESNTRDGVGYVQRSKTYAEVKGANARNVWTIPTQPFPDAHFATFPEELPRRCILAGSREGDIVLDPFMGSGTTAKVARDLGRHAIGIDLNRDYLSIAAKRLRQLSLLAEGAS